MEIRCTHCNQLLGEINKNGRIHQKTRVPRGKYKKQSISGMDTTLGCPNCGKSTNVWEISHMPHVEFIGRRY